MSVFVDKTGPFGRPWPGPGAYANAANEMAWMRQQLLDRRAAERWRRYMVMVLDAAIDQCERCNLAAPDAMRGMHDVPTPELVIALIEQLQIELDREIRPPRSNLEALDELFQLQGTFLPYSDDDDPKAA